jgi:hypothetical protein
MTLSVYLNPLLKNPGTLKGKWMINSVFQKGVPMPTPLTLNYPLAITMWDFSWLERRWPGAGYEDWDSVLAELKQRGYDAVRIDAYPHLVAHDPRRVWELLPEWNVQAWGAPSRCRVQVMPNLVRFIEKCAQHGLRVGLSTWFRQDIENIRLRIHTPADLAQVWRTTLDLIAAHGLIDTILYVDLCNEFPLRVWAPFIYSASETPADYSPADSLAATWMNAALAELRQHYPTLPLCFSLTNDFEHRQQFDVAAHDLLELHLWMVHFSDFYTHIPYNYERFDPAGYDRLALKAEPLYRQRPNHWQQALTRAIQAMAEWGHALHKPLITTECWALVDYKDAPLLSWDWIKDLCALGATTASATGQWAAIATSNFCGPQFVGMWRDVDWHRRLTEIIHNGILPPCYYTQLS